jgi:hypothetical protein
MNINELKANTTVIEGLDGQALIVREDARHQVSWTTAAIAIRAKALARAGIITAVTNQTELDACVSAHIQVRIVRAEAERARKECKQPILEFGRTIDGSAKEFNAPLDAEAERLARLASDYEAVRAQQRRAAEALRVTELSEIERRKQEQLAQAKTIEEIDDIQERAGEEVRQAAAPLETVRAQGQVVREDWEINIIDIWALAKASPACVNIEPRLAHIKTMLNAGIKLPGVEAKRVINSTVRIERQPEPLRI